MNMLELYSDLVGEFSFTEVRDELEKILDKSNISHEHLQDKTTLPRNIKAYKKLESEKRRIRVRITLLLG